MFKLLSPKLNPHTEIDLLHFPPTQLIDFPWRSERIKHLTVIWYFFFSFIFQISFACDFKIFSDSDNFLLPLLLSLWPKLQSWPGYGECLKLDLSASIICPFCSQHKSPKDFLTKVRPCHSSAQYLLMVSHLVQKLKFFYWPTKLSMIH